MIMSMIYLNINSMDSYKFLLQCFNFLCNLQISLSNKYPSTVTSTCLEFLRDAGDCSRLKGNDPRDLRWPNASLHYLFSPKIYL